MRLKLLFIFFIFWLTAFSQPNYDIDTSWIISNLEKQNCRVDEDTLTLLLSSLSKIDYGKLSLSDREKYSLFFTRIATLLLEKDSPDASLFFINKALMFDKQNTDAKLLQARIYLTSGQLYDAYNIVKQVYNNISSSNVYQATAIAQEIAKKYLYTIQQLKKKNKIPQAFEYSKLVDTLLMLYPRMDLVFKPLFDSILVQIYDHYLYKLSEYVKRQDYDSVQIWVNRMIDFCKDYSYMFSDTQRIKHWNNLKNLLCVSIDEALKQGEINYALNILNSFARLCAQVDNFQCTDTIERLRSEIYMVEYQKEMYNLKIAWEKRDISLAKFYLTRLKDFVLKYNIKDTVELSRIEDELHSYEVKFAKSLIDKYIERELYDSAFYILKELLYRKELMPYIPDSLINYYPVIAKSFIISELSKDNISLASILDMENYILKNHFVDDSIVWKLYISRLKDFSFHCAYIREVFFYNLRQYQIFMMNHNFSGAQAVLKNNLNIDDSICPLPKDTVRILLADLHNPLTYELLRKNMFKAFQEKDYEKTFEFLLAAYSFYSDKNLSKYGIVRKDLYKQIISFNTQFVFYAAQRFVRLDSLNLVYNLLKYLQQQNIPAFTTKSLQKELGYRLAIRDFSLDPYEKLKDGIKKYNHNAWWFRYMLKAYVSQRSRMKAFRF